MSAGVLRNLAQGALRELEKLENTRKMKVPRDLGNARIVDARHRCTKNAVNHKGNVHKTQ